MRESSRRPARRLSAGSKRRVALALAHLLDVEAHEAREGERGLAIRERQEEEQTREGHHVEGGHHWRDEVCNGCEARDRVVQVPAILEAVTVQTQRIRAWRRSAWTGAVELCWSGNTGKC